MACCGTAVLTTLQRLYDQCSLKVVPPKKELTLFKMKITRSVAV